MTTVRRYVVRILLVFIGFGFAACGQKPLPPLVASNVVVHQALPGRAMTAAYLSLTNNSRDAIRLSSVASPNFAAVEMHETVLEDGIARMRAVDEVIIAPASTVTFEQGGLHLMLMQPDGAESVTLNFYEDTKLLLSIATPTTQRGN